MSPIAWPVSWLLEKVLGSHVRSSSSLEGVVDGSEQEH